MLSAPLASAFRTLTRSTVRTPRTYRSQRTIPVTASASPYSPSHSHLRTAPSHRFSSNMAYNLLPGKVVVVTGCSTGIGRAIAIGQWCDLTCGVTLSQSELGGGRRSDGSIRDPDDPDPEVKDDFPERMP